MIIFWGLEVEDTVFYFFFFQAEDGIRDPLVTGVQTCALPICSPSGPLDWRALEYCNCPVTLTRMLSPACRSMPVSTHPPDGCRSSSRVCAQSCANKRKLTAAIRITGHLFAIAS